MITGLFLSQKFIPKYLEKRGDSKQVRTARLRNPWKPVGKTFQTKNQVTAALERND